MADGELLVLLGPSGCGKTTTLRLIAGLESPSSGTIRIAGRAMDGVPPWRRDVALVFQDFALYPHLRVAQNLAFGLRMRGVPRAESDRRVGEVARELGIEMLLDRRPGQLSGGQQQRVALGRALARRPQVILLDEPLSNLDAPLRESLRWELVRWHAECGATMIHVTHDQAEAMRLGRRIAVLNHGRLQQLGSPEEIYERPANRFVAEFLGSPPMNFLPVELQLRDNVPWLRGGSWELCLIGRDPQPLAAWVDRPLWLGVRPEHLLVGAAPDGVPTWRGEVLLAQPLGAEALLRVCCQTQELTLKVAAGARRAPGEAIGLHVEPRHCHLFDVATGLAVGNAAGG